VKKRRLALCLSFILVLAGIFFAGSRSNDPVYQGKRLTEWLEDCVPYQEASDDDLSLAERAKRQRAIEAVRQIGAKALPQLIKMLRSRPAWIYKVDDVLENYSRGRIRLVSERYPSPSQLALDGFEILGSRAEPAIPELTHLMREVATCQEAGMALVPIGRAAVPALTQLLTNSVRYVQTEALLALGDIGRPAREVTPILERIVTNSVHPLAGMAMRVLAEVNDTPAKFVPLFNARLNDPIFDGDAAFALARSGPDGLPPLLEALTNQSARIRSLAVAALNPDIVTFLPKQDANRSMFWFQTASYSFPPVAKRNKKLESRQLALRLSRVFEQTNPAVRLKITQALARCGMDAAPGLSKALADENLEVRRCAQAAIEQLGELRDGAIVRGPKTARKIALVFTGHEFAEGGTTILDELARHKARASFFLTGDFLRRTNFAPIVQRIIEEGHYLGPHSDKHLLYCAWDNSKKTLITRRKFETDLLKNMEEIRELSESALKTAYFIPAYEHSNPEIAVWARDFFVAVVNYTPGTHSIADYTGETDTNYVSSQAIYESIVAREQQDPNGLNGFLLLLHLGSGPGRADKFHARFGGLMDYLAGKNYEFVRVDALLEGHEVESPPARYKTQSVRESAMKAERDAFRRRYGIEPLPPESRNE
jgi:peptidoglycan/xylan/chitin deacetylase (PgdA/CDA1 family)